MDSHRVPDPPEPSSHSHNAPESAADAQSASDQLPPVVVPPYWRSASAASRNSILSIAKGIRLEDNSEEPEGTKSPLWAKLVSIESHTVVTGNVKGVGDYVVWICQVQTLDVCPSQSICVLFVANSFRVET